VNLYDVQIKTELDEIVTLQVVASSPEEAELTAINMVELGQAETCGQIVIDCLVC